MKKKILSLFFALLLALGAAVPAAAKTISSPKAETVFFYAADANGEAVLLKAIPLSALEERTHGQADGQNYYFSSTDNYPTTQYTEGRGITLPELLQYVQSVTTVSGADRLTFSGGDRLRLMATDSYGNYTRNWTYDQLYGPKRYFFPGLYDPTHGWNAGWEVAGEDSSKTGLTLEEYNASYKDQDRYYADKRAVLESGEEMPVILAVESFSGRTTTASLVASTEPGIADAIAQNGGVVKGCLKNALTTDYALRLCIPMSEADLMAAHRTAYDNFKWTYQFLLEPAGNSPVVSKGTVARPEAAFSLSGNTLQISLSCATPSASIYYSFDGAPQTLYTGTVSYDVTGRDLASNPVTLSMTAVKEGYSDAGLVRVNYPASGIAFQNLYTAMLGKDLTFSAADSVTEAEWTAWANASLGVSMKTPGGSGYAALSKDKYQFRTAEKTVTFDSSLFTETGSYSFLFYAKGYANKNVSVTLKQAAPTVSVKNPWTLGQAIIMTFDDTAYQKNLSIYVTPQNGSRMLIPASYLDRTVPGQVTIKEDYFALDSSPMTTAGTYVLELSNNAYSPASQTVTVRLEGSGTTPVVPPISGTGDGTAYGIALSWTESPATSMTVVWQDVAESPGYLQVVDQNTYRKSGFDQGLAFSAQCKDVSLDGEGVWHYEATAAGLKPKTAYCYRVGSNDAWSDVHTFTTDDAASRSVTFAYMGDVQPANDSAAEYALWGNLVKSLHTKNPALSFAVLGGDIVNSGISQEQFDQFFQQAEPVFSNVPLFATAGNHESNFLSGKPELMLDLFAFPQNGPAGFEEEFYSLDVGNCHLLVLNSWALSGEQKLTDAQLERINRWIKADLAASGADWQIVVTHVPVYPVHNDTTAEKVQKNWAPIFEQYGVDLVFVGHQHVYARSYPLYQGKVDYENGIPYIMGVSGSKFYSSADETLSEKTIYNTASYQLVKSEGNTLTVESFDKDGNELDYVTVRQRSCRERQFSDVLDSAWYAGAVSYVTEYALFNGTGGTLFSPDLNMTRSMLVTVLYRCAGAPAVTGTIPFRDVAAGQWYSNAVLWASQNGIVNGYDNGLFGTNDGITREQLAAVLYRYAGSKPGGAPLSGFSDTGAVSGYALPAMQWAVSKGIITGFGSSTRLAPQAGATRAQVATMLTRFDKG